MTPYGNRLPCMAYLDSWIESMGVESRALNTAGVVGPILWAFATLYCAAVRPGYDPINQFISELAERGSSTEHIMRLFGFYFPGLLVAAFGVSVLGHRVSSMAAVLVITNGLGRLVAGIFPCDAGCPIMDARSVSQTIHNCAGLLTGLTLPVAALLWFVGSKRVGRSDLFAWYSLASGVVGLLALIVMLMNSPARNSVGLFQRLSVGVANAWVVTLALSTWPLSQKASPSSRQ